MLGLERVTRLCEPLIPGFVRRRARRKAEAWIVERRNGRDGLGAIFPAMVNALEALLELGYPRDDPLVRDATAALRRLVVEHDDWAYCQPCFSAVWDTGLVELSLLEAEAALPDERTAGALARADAWLRDRQVQDGPADWRIDRPDLPPGGWAFQYRNDHYPDLDDTALVLWALHRHDPMGHAPAIERALDWLAGMQSKNGGFGSFDADNTHTLLNEIPFADHGALLDPPTADVSARCALVFARVGRACDRGVLRRVLDFLYAEQEADGSWFGRWGTNYVYGTWSVLAALEHVDDPRKEAHVERAVRWLERTQREDGGWGESSASYFDNDDPEDAGPISTPFQTAWALLGLMAAGVTPERPALGRGASFLLRTQRADGLWLSDEFTAPGFPRVFYLRYHGYQKLFPLWALARYRALSAAGER